MPREQSALLRSTIDLQVAALESNVLQLKDAVGPTRDKLNVLYGRLDPEFLNDVDRIERDDALTLKGKQGGWLKAGKETAAYVDRFRKEHLGGLEANIAQEQRRLAEAVAEHKRHAPSADAARVQAMAQQLRGLDPVTLETLYLSAPPDIQMIIEAVADLTGGKIPMLNENGIGMRWVDMLGSAAREAVITERTAALVPEVADRLKDLRFIRNIYAMVTHTADKLVKDELTKRGVAPSVEARFIDPTTRQPLAARA